MDPIMITEARYYVPDVEAWLPTAVDGHLTLREDAVTDLPLDRFGVDSDCVTLGAITLSARGPDLQDAYGYEFDMDPDTALRLAEALSVAAHAVERASRARGDSDR